MPGTMAPWSGIEMFGEAGFLTSRLDEAVGWARKYSIFQYPFVTACCGMEYMATACSHYDVYRFGAGLPRFSPRQADVLFVVCTIIHKLAPVLKRIYDQMAEPKCVEHGCQLVADRADHKEHIRL